MKTNRVLDSKRSNILTLAALAGIITANMISAKDFFLTNETPFRAQATATWTACPANLFSINPGERVKIDGKDCLMTALRADIHQSATVTIAGVAYQAQAAGATIASAAKIVTATPYTSSGQTDNTEFHIVGPGVNGAYHIGILSTNNANITKEKTQ